MQPPETRAPHELVRDGEGPLLYVTYAFARLFDLQRHILGPNGYGEIVTLFTRGQHAGFDTKLSTRTVVRVNATKAA